MKAFVLLALWTPATIILLIISVISLVSFGRGDLYLTMNPEALAKNQNVFSFPISTLPQNVLPEQDVRITVLQKFFQIYKSPLSESIEDIIKYADLNGIDYSLIPAIAMQESGGCKNIPLDSFNCWGIGIYGDKVLRFSSYKEAIEKVSRTIKEAYIKKGLTNATLVEDRWTPSSRGNWSYAVNFFISKIREIEKNIPAS